MESSGKLIVIEGTDGSGKATQAKKLLDHFEQIGQNTAYFDFPQYEKRSSTMAADYLNGKYGKADEVDPKVASMFYAIDRYDASFEIRKDLKDGKIVVCNRYASANMGHQGGKIEDKAKRTEFIGWLEELEYNFFKIPRPDITILLYVPYLIAQKMVDNKQHRDYLNKGKRDIHEKDKGHLKNAQMAYTEIAKEKGWTVIDCTKDGQIMPIDEIHELVWKEVQKLLNKN